MAAKVLLGVVALTAIVGSPFAYNHFKSPSGETRKEEVKNEQPVAAEKPSDSVPEIAADRQEENQRAPKQSDDTQNPKNDKCNLGVRTDWASTGGPLSDENQCVRKVILDQRGQQ